MKLQVLSIESSYSRSRFDPNFKDFGHEAIKNKNMTEPEPD
jgi:hypothetical protein